MKGSLRVPSTDKTEPVLMNTERPLIAHEIENLPYADPASALSLAHKMLHRMNRFELLPKDRLQAALPFHSAFVRFIQHFRQQQTRGLFTQDINTDELDRLMDFTTELCYAYKHIIRNTLIGNNRPSGFASVMHMALLYQQYYVFLSFCRGRMVKPMQWREIHYLYHIACQLQIQKNNAQGANGKTSTVEQTYKQVLLLGMASPHGLSSEDLWQTFDYIHKVSKLLQLIHTESATRDSYFIHKDCQQPVAISSSDYQVSVKVLDMTPLVNNLHKHIQAARSGEPLQHLGFQNHSRDKARSILQHLQLNWCRNPNRKASRHVIHEHIGLVWGIETICDMLDPEQRRHQTLGFHKSKERRAWSHGEDESITGLRIRLDKQCDLTPDSGQITALLREHHGKKVMEAGLIKWTAINDGNTLSCGVERLRGQVKKVDILDTSGETTDRNGLIILSRDTQGQVVTRLVTPIGIIQSQAKSTLQYANQPEQHTFTALTLSQRTRHAEIWHIRLDVPVQDQGQDSSVEATHQTIQLD